MVEPGKAVTRTTCALSSRELIIVPPDVFLMSGLRVLDLSRNKLKVLPPEIKFLSSLLELNVSRNSLKSIPAELGYLAELETINALSNKLNQRTIPFGILAKMPQLRLLDLRYNEKCKSRPEIEIFFKESNSSDSFIKILITKRVKPIRDPGIVGDHACDRDATKLRSQLEPWGTPMLRRRLAECFGVITDPEKHRREYVMEALLGCYAKEGPRSVRFVTPMKACRHELYDELLKELEMWAALSKGPRERPTINATGYMILRSPAEFSKKSGQKALLAAAKVKRHQCLWDLAATIIEETDPEFSKKYTAVAFTHNFVGSPHIDTQNIGPFYALGLGTYTGGELCVESGVREITCCDILRKLALVDGRYPHWVAPYDGVRYSVIYYQTLGVPSACGAAVLGYNSDTNTKD